jgi:hypothetical protein
LKGGFCGATLRRVIISDDTIWKRTGQARDFPITDVLHYGSRVVARG